MQIKPTTANLNSWIQNYVPEKDLFFLTTDVAKDWIYTKEILLVPIEELFNSSLYTSLEYVNSYEYWNLKNASHVIIADKKWIETLPKEEQFRILNTQLQVERGLTIPIEFIQQVNEIPSNYIINKNIVIQKSMWEGMSIKIKEKLLTTLVYEWWDNGDCIAIPKESPPFFKKFANTFSNIHGGNCLAATIFAISKGQPESLINEWIDQKTFLEKLKEYNYKLTDDIENLEAKDVVIWKDENNIIQHAAYHINAGLFFNKHGQTIFNPWKILLKNDLYKEWNEYKPLIYRSF